MRDLVNRRSPSFHWCFPFLKPSPFFPPLSVLFFSFQNNTFLTTPKPPVFSLLPPPPIFPDFFFLNFLFHRFFSPFHFVPQSPPLTFADHPRVQNPPHIALAPIFPPTSAFPPFFLFAKWSIGYGPLSRPIELWLSTDFIRFSPHFSPFFRPDSPLLLFSPSPRPSNIQFSGFLFLFSRTLLFKAPRARWKGVFPLPNFPPFPTTLLFFFFFPSFPRCWSRFHGKSLQSITLRLLLRSDSSFYGWFCPVGCRLHDSSL